MALSKSAKLKASAVADILMKHDRAPESLTRFFAVDDLGALVAAAEQGKLRWNRATTWEEKAALYADALKGKPFEDWLDLADRAEQVDQEKLYAPVWPVVNAHLKTSARSIPELTEQLGVARFGKRAIIGDAFCGGGSIPFEAARLGCDVVASDLNPVACMLTWGALNMLGADAVTRLAIETTQKEVAAAVDAEITELGIEHNDCGERAKTFLYCLEANCPETGWSVPLLPSFVISQTRNIICELVPNLADRCFDFRIVVGATESEMHAAERGTVGQDHLHYEIEGHQYRSSIAAIRGDVKATEAANPNAIRPWSALDIKALDTDKLRERLYAIQWIKNGSSRFAPADAGDLSRESVVGKVASTLLREAEPLGLISYAPIETGSENEGPIRTMGWRYWHQFHNPRQLLQILLFRKYWPQSLDAAGAIITAKLADRLARNNRWDPSGEKAQSCFDTPGLKTYFNYACRGWSYARPLAEATFPLETLAKTESLQPCSAAQQIAFSDIWITDPPYADAIRYEEITEFFIAWLRKNPPEPFKNWVWDSRRALAIKGTGEEFKAEMIAAYRNLAAHMPDNGLQIVMFTHQDAGVWADMAAIMWGAGLQVTAAWYVATETTSELKKGGYVQGTVLLVLRKRGEPKSGYRDEITQEITAEVASQIESLTGLNDRALSHGRSENLFEDADLQMAGYAAALRVLTAYASIDGEDMAAYASRPRIKGRADPVRDIIDFAAETANTHLVPRGLSRDVWAGLTREERFYLKMVDLETAGLKKLDNYQNFAKAFRADWQPLMASAEPNAARLKSSVDFGKGHFGEGFGETTTRHVLWAMRALQEEDADGRAVLDALRAMPRYFERRTDARSIAAYLAAKRSGAERTAASTLADLIDNERLG